MLVWSPVPPPSLRRPCPCMRIVRIESSDMSAPLSPSDVH